ncbi:MAG: aldehyde dehydrogenase [Alphaproteobacteria bacterium]
MNTQSYDLPTFDPFINGRSVSPAARAYFETNDPFTGEPWAKVGRCDGTDIDLAVESAWRAFHDGPWAEMKPTRRGEVLRRFGAVLSKHAEELADIEVRDNGKLRTEMLAQCRYISEWYAYFGGLADKIQGSVIPIDKDDVFNFTVREPLGVIAAITPWNSPLLLLSWKLAPALAAGNTLVLKPSEFTSVSSLRFAELAREAGVPDGVFNVVTGYGPEAGAALVAHPKVAKVAFTGGGDSGALIYQAAARDLKPCSLELGGKSPNIILNDARIEDAVKGAVSGIFAATGQTCIAGSRLLVHNDIYDAFVPELLEFAASAQMGDPSLPETQIGPITTPPQYQRVLDYIEIAQSEGATLLLGGKPAKGRPECGKSPWFVEPTIFGDVTNDMRIAQEEVFGPILSIIRFETDEKAIEIANDSQFGLAAGVWTQSINRALRFSQALRAGTVWVNTYRSVSFMSPFGGYKKSGIGRENGMEAIESYMQTKSVWISTAEEVPDPFVIR